MLPLGEKTAVQVVVGCIVWAFSKLKKPRCREMSARGYALHSVYPQLSFLFFLFPEGKTNWLEPGSNAGPLDPESSVTPHWLANVYDIEGCMYGVGTMRYDYGDYEV